APPAPANQVKNISAAAAKTPRRCSVFGPRRERKAVAATLTTRNRHTAANDRLPAAPFSFCAAAQFARTTEDRNKYDPDARTESRPDTFFAGPDAAGYPLP